ncbi:hypothetical protein RDWZM_003164 [Blomia tropicalis]|uniref:Uncharacterized protein n=1 Tax=Blomia tropicalis TaxID=40697 RepID=A0A9Q0RS95_BLOTA|nr:hypothetical protein RDWZM_003164 [Blomia tropicalis]
MSSDKYTPVTHVIFDLDGTLIDSEKYLHKAITDVLRDHGKTMNWELQSLTTGLFITKSAPIIVENLKLTCTPEEYIRQILIRYKQYVVGQIDGVGIKFLPGVVKLITHLSNNKIPMAICTGSMQETFDFKVERFGDFFKPGNIFQHIVIGANDPEVKQNKPMPDPYLVCMNRFNNNKIDPIQPNQFLAFEDSPTGLASAVSAGCQSILVQDNPKIDYSYFNIKPILTLRSLEHFKPEEFGLPPFPNQSNNNH